MRDKVARCKAKNKVAKEAVTPVQRQLVKEYTKTKTAWKRKHAKKTTVIEPKPVPKAPAVKLETVIEENIETVTKTVIEPKAIAKTPAMERVIIEQDEVVQSKDTKTFIAVQRQVADHLCLTGGWWSWLHG